MHKGMIRNLHRLDPTAVPGTYRRRTGANTFHDIPLRKLGKEALTKMERADPQLSDVQCKFLVWRSDGDFTDGQVPKPKDRIVEENGTAWVVAKVVPGEWDLYWECLVTAG